MNENRIQKPAKYAKIDLQKRIKLTKLVLTQKFTITLAAKRLGIKISTAKLIIKKYRQTGTFFQKIQQKMRRTRAQQNQNLIQGQQNVININGYQNLGVFNELNVNSMALDYQTGLQIHSLLLNQFPLYQNLCHFGLNFTPITYGNYFLLPNNLE